MNKVISGNFEKIFFSTGFRISTTLSLISIRISIQNKPCVQKISKEYARQVIVQKLLNKARVFKEMAFKIWKNETKVISCLGGGMRENLTTGTRQLITPQTSCFNFDKTSPFSCSLDRLLIRQASVEDTTCEHVFQRCTK